MSKFYQITTEEKKATINIYGDITSWPWKESDVSGHNIKAEIDGLDVDQIDVCINSYGGEVAEALAIYNALKRHKAKVTTYCDGFACSAASIIFCAGDERIMGELSFLMIHNAMFGTYGNAEELRKAADDCEKINSAAVTAYCNATGMSVAQVQEMMDAETWITAEEAVAHGFATSVREEEKEENPTQSARQTVHEMVMIARKERAPKKEPSGSAAPVAPVDIDGMVDAIINKFF